MISGMRWYDSLTGRPPAVVGEFDGAREGITWKNKCLINNIKLKFLYDLDARGHFKQLWHDSTEAAMAWQYRKKVAEFQAMSVQKEQRNIKQLWQHRKKAKKYQADMAVQWWAEWWGPL